MILGLVLMLLYPRQNRPGFRGLSDSIVDHLTTMLEVHVRLKCSNKPRDLPCKSLDRMCVALHLAAIFHIERVWTAPSRHRHRVGEIGPTTTANPMQWGS